MANPITRSAKIGSPSAVLTVPRGTTVSPGTQSRTRALQTVLAKTRAPTLGTPASQFALLQAGPPLALTGAYETAQQGVQQAEEAYYGMAPFQEQMFTQVRPKFDSQAVTRMIPSIMAIAALGGQASRGNALGMLRGLTASIKGAQEGNRDAYEQALADYQMNYNEFAAREAVRRRQYDVLKNAARDGYERALNRSNLAAQAINDWNESASKNLQLVTTYASNTQKLLRQGGIAAPGAAKGKQAAAAPVAGGAEIDPKVKLDRDKKYPKVKNGIDYLTQAYSDTDSLITQLLTEPSLVKGLKQISGRFAGTREEARFLSQEASDARVLYDSIISKGTLKALQELRNASPTGGAMGNTSNKDVDLLRASVGPLQLTQSPERVIQALKNYRQTLYQVLRSTITSANEDYAYDPSLAFSMVSEPAPLQVAGSATTATPTAPRVTGQSATRERVPAAAASAGITQAMWDAATEEEKKPWR